MAAEYKGGRSSFLIIGEETPVCPECGRPLKLRDHRRRIHKKAGEERAWYLIPRWECQKSLTVIAIFTAAYRTA